MRRTLPLLCLLLAACDRGKYETHRNPSESSARATAALPEPQPPIAANPEIDAQVLAADADPALDKLKEAYAAQVRAFANPPAEIDGQLSAVPFPDNAPIAAYYAANHPLAGLRWMRSASGAPPEMIYANALYAASPATAFRVLSHLPTQRRAGSYFEALLYQVKPADTAALWETVLAPGIYADPEKLTAVKQLLIIARGRIDPMAGWRDWQAHIAPTGDPSAYLGLITEEVELDPATAYPVQLLDQLATPELRAQALTHLLSRERTPANLAPVLPWLDAQPSHPAYDPPRKALARITAAR